MDLSSNPKNSKTTTNLPFYDFWGKEGKKSIVEWEIWTCHKKWGIMVYI